MTNRWRPSPALVLAFIALLVALGGTAVANGDRLPLIGSRHVADDSLRSKDIHDGTLKRRDFRSGVLRGPSDATGLTVTRISAQGTGSARAACPADMQVLSGGGGSTPGGTVLASLPSGDNTAWEVTSSDATAVVAAFAYCSADVTVTR